MKTARKSKTPYTENINTHVPIGWLVHSTFAYEDVLDPLKSTVVNTVWKNL